MVTRMARKRGVTLPFRFWNTPLWKKDYTKEIIKANTLLKVYPEKVLVNTVNHPTNSWVVTLFYNGWPSLFDLEEKRLASEKKEVVEYNEDNVRSVPNSYGKESKLSKLRKLDE